MSESCKTCRFFDAYDDTVGRCRRYPPRLAPTSELQEFAKGEYGDKDEWPETGLWPIVGAGRWCGEFAKSQ